MRLFSTHSRLLRWNGAQGRVAAFALSAGVFGLMAGCSSGSAGAVKPLTPRMALTLAADQAQRVNSLAATISVQVAGTMAETTAGTVQIQLKPSLLIDEKLNVSAQGQQFPIEGILSPGAMYLKSPALSSVTGQAGKAWVEIPFSDLAGTAGSALSSLFQSVQNSNPLTQTKMLAASKNVREAGTQVIDGVRTTHYVGTFTPSAALATLSPSLRKDLEPDMKLITSDIRFGAWVDGQHIVRKFTETETVTGGETVNVTMHVSAVNQPVHVTLPSASQVITPPQSALGSA